MNDKFFIDTNILVYSFDRTAPEKQVVAQDIIKTALTEQTGCISSQVVQEFLNVAMKKFNPSLSSDDALIYLQNVLTPLCDVFTSIELYKLTIAIVHRWQFSFYDAMMVAAALQAGCQILYSEDLQHGQQIESLEVVNPFALA